VIKRALGVKGAGEGEGEATAAAAAAAAADESGEGGGVVGQGDRSDRVAYGVAAGSRKEQQIQWLYRPSPV